MGKDKTKTLRIIDKIVRTAKSRGLSQKDLEEKLTLPHGRITKWLGGRTEPSGSVVWAASQLLGVDVAYLLDPEAGEPRLPGRDEFQLCIQLMKKLGPEESFRRLTRSEGPG